MERKWSYKLPTISGKYYVAKKDDSIGIYIENINVRSDGSVDWFVGDGPMGDGVMILEKPDPSFQFYPVCVLPDVVWENEPPVIDKKCSTCMNINKWCPYCMYSNRNNDIAGNKWEATVQERNRYEITLKEWEKTE